MIERAVAARAGKVELAKLDMDANQNLARTYRIQSIPAVKAFRDGEVVGGVRRRATARRRSSASLIRWCPPKPTLLVAAGDEESLRQAVELEPTRADAAVPLARILHGRGESDEALEVLGRVPGQLRRRRAHRPDRARA